MKPVLSMADQTCNTSLRRLRQDDPWILEFKVSLTDMVNFRTAWARDPLREEGRRGGGRKKK